MRKLHDGFPAVTTRLMPLHHVFLQVNFDCCAMYVADAGPLKEALSLTPVFLQVGCVIVLSCLLGGTCLSKLLKKCSRRGYARRMQNSVSF